MTINYNKEYDQLLSKLHETCALLSSDFTMRLITVFLTDATGFLGTFVLYDLLLWHKRVKKVICLVQVSNHNKELARLKEGVNRLGKHDMTSECKLGGGGPNWGSKFGQF